MNRDQLLKQALLLAAPGPDAAGEYAECADRMAAEMNRRMASRKDIDALIGSRNLAMMEDNHRNHARFMTALFSSFDPAVLVETVLWVFRAYRSHGFQLAYWPAQLDTWLGVMKETLSERSFGEIEPVYRWMIINQPAFACLSDEQLASGDI